MTAMFHCHNVGGNGVLHMPSTVILQVLLKI